ncbi:MAG: sugar phosphate isomerase/epimerase [Gaiellales bacterium]|nr:MAG: sugar phosphate isomerase/epimerase [Gaiellales bacterium]
MKNFRFGGQAAGLEGIEFLTGHGFDFADLNLNEIDKIRREDTAMLEAARDGLFFVAHAPDLRVDDPEGMARIEEAVRYSAIFRPRTITIHPILAPFSNTPEKIEMKIREIGRLSELAVSFGSRIACENTAEEPEDMRPLLEEHPDVVLTIDIGHSELLGERNKAFGFIETWPERIGHVHIHDNVGGDTYYDDLHLPLGEGRIDFAGILGALGGLPQEITITFEMPRQKAWEGLIWLRERNLA